MSYQNQLDILFQSYLDRYCKKADRVEFIISSACNQKCEYCYLYKHGHEMGYPAANKKEDILQNLKLFLEYLEEEEYAYNLYDVFSGEFFQLPYWEDVFQVFYEHELKYKRRRNFSLPTNASFVIDDVKTARVQAWIDKFHEIDVDLSLSCSVDGPTEVEALERPNHEETLKTDEYYDKLFTFISKNHFACHPMITKGWLQDYKKNYDFFVEKVKEYDIFFYQNKPKNIEVNSYNLPMMLEVRDSEQWDEESLKLYEEFLYYVAEKDLNEVFNGDKEKYCFKFFDDFSPTLKNISPHSGVQPYIIGYPIPQGNRMSCTVQKGLVCRLGDLTCAPCHRLYYEQFHYGKFVKSEDNSKIIGVQGINPMLAFKVDSLNPIRSMLRCSYCKYNTICVQGCLGSQFEHTGELFSAQPQVCKMFEIKYQTIHNIAKKYGLYDIAINMREMPIERREFIQNVKTKIFND